MILPNFSDWFTTLSLVFGGCCSNAITLEQLTSEYPNAGSLITFFQFLLISLHGLPKHVTWTRYGPQFRPRRIPLTPYLIQVALFYFISLLNNAAFGYNIPMAVHIIFRSGGLIISMLLGWLVAGKRYTITQICSVNLVTLGVVLTTLSASPSSHSYSKSPELGSDTLTYITGIAILTLALVFSGFLGLVQDWTYSKYGRPAPPSSSPSANGHSTTEKSNDKGPPAWQESMFYLHFLALPMFISLRSSLSSQIAQINSGSHTALSLPLPLALSKFEPNLSIPTAYIPLTLNTLTQLVCVAGVHRLTTRVSALTVTLVLVVRKAVSLVLSVVGIGLVQRNRGRAQGDVDMVMMWAGAAMVLVGTIFYSGASRASKPAAAAEGIRKDDRKGEKEE